jgi:microcystin-dependent protein
MNSSLLRRALPAIVVLAASMPALAQDQFLGEIRWGAFSFAPIGWALCNGQILSVSSNTALFSLLGTTYGGDGKTTFALPDMRGRAAMHPGQGPGLSPRDLGEAGGAESVTLTESEMPMHTHPAYGSNFTANRVFPGTNFFAYVSEFDGTNYLDSNVRAYRTTNGTTAMAPGVIGPAGGGQPAPNLPPYNTANCIIAIQGSFPARN